MAPPSPQGSAATAGADVAAPTPQATTEEVITEARIALSGNARIDITGDRVMRVRGDENVTLLLDPERDTVTIDEDHPDWVEQRLEGGRVIAFFGSAGWLDISSDRVRVRKRFFGWENFIFGDGSYAYSAVAALAPAPVPLPAGVVLLGGALAGLGLARRRR